MATASFGVAGIGSLFYLAYAAGEADFPGIEQALGHGWGVRSELSVLVHGVLAKPAMDWLEREHEPA